MSESARIYQLKITLPYIEPAIWRRLEVPGHMTFSDLHDVIQVAMGWEDCHLWAFFVENTEIGPPAPAEFVMPGAPRPRSAGRTTIDEMLTGRRIRFRYVYDMGDDWLHDIKIEKVFAAETDVHYPRCTDGARAGPLEDCGGFPGYMNLLETLANPRHPDHEEMLEWVGGEWDAEAFDIDAVNAVLQPRKRKPAGSRKSRK